MKNNLRYWLVALLAFAAATESQAKTAKEEIAECPMKAACVLNLYTFEERPSTPAPAGYEPFYISHYGRHGSRWMDAPHWYETTMGIYNRAAEAGILTEKGKEIYEVVKAIYADGRDRVAELTPLGQKQHFLLGQRMIRNFPQVFAGSAKVNAEATHILRCAMSMLSFCDALKGINPEMEISYAAGVRPTRYLNFNSLNYGGKMTPEILDWKKNGGTWKEPLENLGKKLIKPKRLMAELFTRPDMFTASEQRHFMFALYCLDADQTSTESGISCTDLFTLDELYDMYVVHNYYHYQYYACWPGNDDIPLNIGTILLDEMIGKADAAVAGNGISADLRFGHDISLMGLMPLMDVPGFNVRETDPYQIAEKWRLYDITPMAANLQWIFFKKPGNDDVLVKMLYNEYETPFPVETDCYPYYHWKDVSEYYHKKIAAIEAAEKK